MIFLSDKLRFSIDKLSLTAINKLITNGLPYTYGCLSAATMAHYVSMGACLQQVCIHYRIGMRTCIHAYVAHSIKEL